MTLKAVWISCKRCLLFVKLFEQAAFLDSIEEMEVNELFGLGILRRRKSSRQVIDRVLHALHIHIGRTFENFIHIEIVGFGEKNRVSDRGVFGQGFDRRISIVFRVMNGAQRRRA